VPGSSSHCSNRELVDRRVADRGAALLAVHQPGGLLVVGLGLVYRNEQFAGHGVVHGRRALRRDEGGALIESEHERIGKHGAAGFEISADRADVTKDLRTLVALQLLLVAPDPGDSGEAGELLAVYREAVDAPIALPHFERGKPQRVLVGHIISSGVSTHHCVASRCR
jgi:hypothetical protein